jgi:hypothetical protein
LVFEGLPLTLDPLVALHFLLTGGGFPKFHADRFQFVTFVFPARGQLASIMGMAVALDLDFADLVREAGKSCEA